MTTPTITTSLALDLGQSESKVRFADGSTPRLPGIRTDSSLPEQIAEIVQGLVIGSASQIDTVAAGVSGLVDTHTDAQHLLDLLQGSGIARVVLAHDSITSYLGAVGDVYGAVVAAGTGVVTLGVGPESVARVDGWGNIMGDAGSGYWIGRAGLEAAMRAHDGRAAPTLLSGLLSRWPDPEQAYMDLQQDPDRVRTVAAFAREVAELAPYDETASAICVEAGEELFVSVDTALRRVGGPPGAWRERPLIGLTGSVFGSFAIRTAFETLLHSSWPEAVSVSASGTGLDGAATLLALGSGHPLCPYIGDTARR